MSTPPKSSANLPVPAGPVVEQHEPHSQTGFSEFAAHILGQPGQKRGLRGGRETLKAARAVYLGTEFSGPDDRRPPKGLLKKKEI